jgi:hypothetical protein
MWGSTCNAPETSSNMPGHPAAQSTFPQKLAPTITVLLKRQLQGKEHEKAWATQSPNMTKRPPTVHPDKPVGNNNKKPSANLVGTAQVNVRQSKGSMSQQ